MGKLMEMARQVPKVEGEYREQESKLLFSKDLRDKREKVQKASAAFACSTHVLRVESGVLAEQILVAADNADIDLWLLEHPESRGAVVYTTAEVEALRGVSPGCLRLLHETKTVFGALVEEEEPRTAVTG